VEDNATNRLLTQRQLSRLGHEMVAAPTGREGVRVALDAGEAIDVVLMDRHLPDVDGCAATEEIRAGRSADRCYLPIVGVTADATPDAREACLVAGMDEVLTKPVDLRQLGAALARAAGAIDAGVRSADSAAAGVEPLPESVRSVLDRVDGDPAAAAEVIATYLGELPGRRLRIQASLRRGEARAVLAAAESLRTSSDTLGAAAVAGTCAALGAAARTADLAAARAFLPSLMAQCQQLAAELAGYAAVAGVEAALARSVS
jgi:CheY-like chemotaxis protein/HPt (histidine-containing phosphotransfer) domain-containing protein